MHNGYQTAQKDKEGQRTEVEVNEGKERIQVDFDVEAVLKMRTRGWWIRS